jgi:methionyl-tRNA synthetase
MRLGVNEFKLPEYIPTRGFLLLEGQKFSKSRGWYVSLRDFLNRFPADYLRYYLAAITLYSQLDGNFDWRDFQKRINNELLANIGNFIHRTLTFVWSNYDGRVPEPENFDAFDREFKEKIKTIAGEVAQEIAKIELSRGLRKIIEFSTFCNQYFQRKQPWTDKEKAKTCLYLCVNAVRSLAILLEPYTPFSAERLWQQLNLESSVHEQRWDSASELAISEGHRIKQPSVLFKKVENEDVKKEREKLLKLAAN